MFPKWILPLLLSRPDKTPTDDYHVGNMYDARILSNESDLLRYDAWLRSPHNGSVWQSRAWAAYQQALGRQTRTYVAEESGAIVASAQIVIDRTTGGLSIWDCPRGPLWTDGDALSDLLMTIETDARRERCLGVFLSPSSPLPPIALRLSASGRHEQPQATVMLDLRLSDDELLAQMHPKGRYNIRLAQRHGVRIEQSTDTDAFYALLQATGERDGFKIGPKRRYDDFLSSLEGSFMLMAYDGQTPIAGLLGVIWRETGIYYYGASDASYRRLMAPYLLQWEAMQLCKSRQCMRYDLLGVDPPGIVTTWAGVTDFKQKFGGVTVEYPPEKMIALRPWLYRGLRMKRKLLG